MERFLTKFCSHKSFARVISDLLVEAMVRDSLYVRNYLMNVQTEFSNQYNDRKKIWI